MRGKFETFLFIFLVMLFVAGLSLALYPYVQGAIVDGIMERQSEEFLSRVEIISVIRFCTFARNVGLE